MPPAFMRPRPMHEGKPRCRPSAALPRLSFQPRTETRLKPLPDESERPPRTSMGWRSSDGRQRQRLLVHARRSLDVQDVIRDWLAPVDWSARVRVSVDVDPYSFL